MKGDKISKAGNPSKIKRKIFGFFCLANTKRLSKVKYTGIIKNEAPTSLIVKNPHSNNQKNNGAMIKLPAFSGL